MVPTNSISMADPHPPNPGWLLQRQSAWGMVLLRGQDGSSKLNQDGACLRHGARLLRRSRSAIPCLVLPLDVRLMRGPLAPRTTPKPMILKHLEVLMLSL